MKNLNCSFVGMNIKNKIVQVVSFLIAPIIFLSCNSPSNKEVNSDLKPLEYPVELDIETLMDNTEYTDPCFGHTDPPTGFNSKNSIN
jgi:hypothetical protein